MTKLIELKAYKMLAEIRGSVFSQIKQTAKNAVKYKSEKPVELIKEFEHIANPAKWDYSGLMSKEEKAILEVLEYLLDDNQKEILKYKEWKIN